jgi:hypothetical protein
MLRVLLPLRNTAQQRKSLSLKHVPSKSCAVAHVFDFSGEILALRVCATRNTFT